MKWMFYIVCFFGAEPLAAQEDFLSIYLKIERFGQSQEMIQRKIQESAKDTVQFKAYLKQSRKFMADSIVTLATQVLNLTFPDISFTGVNNKAHSVSDFSGKDVIVNYNYLYCKSCLDRIDSTLKLVNGRKIQLIVLFLDQYQKEMDDLKQYGDNVIYGFINDDTKDLISLGLGDNSMYYLNKERQIEFFDKIYLKDPNLAWTIFLKSYTK